MISETKRFRVFTMGKKNVLLQTKRWSYQNIQIIITIACPQTIPNLQTSMAETHKWLFWNSLSTYFMMQAQYYKFVKILCSMHCDVNLKIHLSFV